MKFLKEFGKENRLVEQYSDDFEQTGGMEPTCFSMVLNAYNQFDVDIRIQLFIAMHYLTLNDAMAERKEFKPYTSYINYHLGALSKSSKELKKKE